MHQPIAREGRNPAGLIWLDRSHALIARAFDSGTLVTHVDRDLDSESAYLLRVAREAEACDPLVVIGADAARTAFEHEYVALYDRPDRIIDAGMELEPQPRELTDRLRFLLSAR